MMDIEKHANSYNTSELAISSCITDKTMTIREIVQEALKP